MVFAEMYRQVYKSLRSDGWSSARLRGELVRPAPHGLAAPAEMGSGGRKRVPECPTLVVPKSVFRTLTVFVLDYLKLVTRVIVSLFFTFF